MNLDVFDGAVFAIRAWCLAEETIVSVYMSRSGKCRVRFGSWETVKPLVGFSDQIAYAFEWDTSSASMGNEAHRNLAGVCEAMGELASVEFFQGIAIVAEETGRGVLVEWERDGSTRFVLCGDEEIVRSVPPRFMPSDAIAALFAEWHG